MPATEDILASRQAQERLVRGVAARATGREDVVGNVNRLVKKGFSPKASGDGSEPQPRLSKRVSKKSTRNTMLSQSVHVSQGRGSAML